MANSIALANKFMPILDEIYRKSSLTAFMDAMTKPVDFSAANEVKVFKISVVGMGTYSRATGYAAGDVTATWETIQLQQERGRAFNIDKMDNEESLGMAFGKLSGEFIRTKVVPEVDAYRFATMADWSGIGAAAATLDTAAKVLAAVDVASGVLDTAEVPKEGRVLFISDAHYRLLINSVTRSLDNQEVFNRALKQMDELKVIPVPQGRFYDEITLDAGATSSAGGYANAGSAINFMMVHPSASDQATKLAQLKIFSPEENQTADAWLMQYRLYHDIWVYDNKLAGIYKHTVT